MNEDTVTCPGCQGEGFMVTRVQRLTPQGRRCTVQQIPCLLCQGRKAVTPEEIAAFEACWTRSAAQKPPRAGEEGG
jgi:hypothetical protein